MLAIYGLHLDDIFFVKKNAISIFFLFSHKKCVTEKISKEIEISSLLMVFLSIFLNKLLHQQPIFAQIGQNAIFFPTGFCNINADQ